MSVQTCFRCKIDTDTNNVLYCPAYADPERKGCKGYVPVCDSCWSEGKDFINKTTEAAVVAWMNR